MKERIMKLSEFENKIKWKEFTIYSTYAGRKCPNWEINGNPNYHHSIVVVTLKLHVFGDTFKTRRLTFDYWGSLMEPVVRDKDLIYVFKYYLQDGWSAENESFESWCGEFGYDEDSRKILRIIRQYRKGIK